MYANLSFLLLGPCQKLLPKLQCKACHLIPTRQNICVVLSPKKNMSILTAKNSHQNFYVTRQKNRETGNR